MHQTETQILSQLYQSQGNTLQEIVSNFQTTNKQQLTQLYKYVTSEEELENVNILGNVIGIDIEQTTDIGFDGQISLIQIKDNNDVYIIDVIEIGEESQKLKNKIVKIFCDEKIIKVFYAGNTDLQWLKRDFGIDVQNFQDIKEIADKCKIKGGSSIINLWKSYCNHIVSKSYKSNMQTSDWAERPLSQEQLIYAAYDCYYLPYLRYILLLEFSQQDIKEQINMVNKFTKTTKKEYKKPIQNIQELAKIVDKEFNLLIQISKEYNDEKQIYIHLQVQNNAAQLVKFISLEIMKIRQDYALHHNDPVEALEENQQVILIAIKIYEAIQIQNIQAYRSFYVDLGLYQNRQYQITLEKIKESIEQEWEEYSCLFYKGLYQSFIYDRNFIKFGLNYIYDALQNPTLNNQQQVDEKKKQKQAEFADKYTRKKPAYGSCKIYTKEDFFLCNCDEKKIRWYLKQELADLICEDPLTIKLKFDPSGFKEEGSDQKHFVTIERVNQCVICGNENNLLKFHIVPVLFKKHIQGKRSYDVVCLCLQCHHKASGLNDKLKLQIAEKYNVQINKNTRQNLNELIKILTKGIDAYKKKNINLPQDAQIKFQQSFTQQLNQIFNLEQFKDINQFDLSILNYNEDNVIINDNLYQFSEWLKKNQDKFKEKVQENTDEIGKLVIDKLQSEQEINDFLAFWRDQFISELKPQFLNEAWAIDHKYKRTFGEKSQYKQQDV